MSARHMTALIEYHSIGSITRIIGEINRECIVSFTNIENNIFCCIRFPTTEIQADFTFGRSINSKFQFILSTFQYFWDVCNHRHLNIPKTCVFWRIRINNQSKTCFNRNCCGSIRIPHIIIIGRLLCPCLFSHYGRLIGAILHINCGLFLCPNTDTGQQKSEK